MYTKEMMMRVWKSGTMLIFMCGILPAPTLAQGGANAEGPAKIGCIRGRTLPECRSFWLFEMQAPVLVTQKSTPRGLFNLIEWNFGHMVNLGDDWAVGGLVTGGIGYGDGLRGIKARVRRWLNTDLSIEAEAGALWGQTSSSVGGTAALRFNVRDMGSIFLQWEAPQTREVTDFSGRQDPGGLQHDLSVGVGLGSVPAFIGTGLYGIGFLGLMLGWGVGN